jgi:hypothetical protein
MSAAADERGRFFDDVAPAHWSRIAQVVGIEPVFSEPHGHVR